MAEKTLWEHFNLGKNNPDPAGGLMYCMMYGLNRIKTHRAPVVQALKEMGVEL